LALFDTTQLALQRAMAGTALRGQALAQNMANANTPGYKRVDVDFHASLAKALADGDPREATFTLQRDTTATVRADGNSVDVDLELASLQENSLENQALTAVARARIQMIKTAITGQAA
jgi:flagellar basal-body rod protein FlgB